jgi:hypothetical protein
LDCGSTAERGMKSLVERWADVVEMEVILTRMVSAGILVKGAGAKYRLRTPIADELADGVSIDDDEGDE